MKIRFLRLIITFMKLSVYGTFLQVLLLNVLLASGVSGQKSLSIKEVYIDLRLENASIVKTFNIIESKTNYKFNYNKPELDKKTQVNININNGSVADALLEISEQTGLKFRQVNGSINVDKPGSNTIGGIEIILADVDVSGKVTDENGEGLPGASIIQKGTTNGITTDLNGNYKLNIPEDAVLVISFVGYKTQEVTLGGRSTVDVQMQLDAAQLNEVVVVGYGQQTVKTTAGSVFKLDGTQFESRPQTNVLQSLQGAIPGLAITRGGGGKVGREANGIIIRGITSRNAPGVLVVIDGIIQPEQDAAALDQLNPRDIESITVLKDAQAAIYGARAAGGVIQVTTKKGKSNTPVFKYSGNLSINRLGRYPKKAGFHDFTRTLDDAFIATAGVGTWRPYQGIREGLDNGDWTPNDGQQIVGPFSDVPWVSTTSFDPLEEYWGGNRYMQTHNFSVSGNTERSNYYVSLGVIDQPGVLKSKYGKNNNLRNFARVKYSFDVSDKLTLSTNISMERQKIEEPTLYNNGEQQTFFIWSNQTPLTEGGLPIAYGGFTSPVAYFRDAGDLVDDGYRNNIQFSGEFRPVKGLSINGDYSINIDNHNRNWIRKIVDQYHHDGALNRTDPSRSAAGNSMERSVHRVLNLYGNYSYTLNEDHAFGLTVGGAHEELDYDFFSASRQDLLSEALPALGFGDPEEQGTGYTGTHWSINSLFSRLNYTFKGKYTIEGNYRRDASSRFAKDFRVGNFFGGAASWIISEEVFMDGISDIVSNLKLRVSVGQLGNQVNTDDSSDNFRFKSFVDIGGQYPFGNPDSPGRSLQASIAGGQLSAPERKWETTSVKNIGLDFGLFDKLNGSFDYFIKKTDGVLIGLEAPGVLGVSPPLTNGGEVETKGWELSLTWNDQIGTDFSYYARLALSDDNNMVTNLEDARVAFRGVRAFTEGYASNTLFAPLYDGIIQNQDELDAYTSEVSGLPGNLRVGAARYKDLDGDGVFEPTTLYKPGDDESGDMVAIDDTRQHLLFSLTLGANWKGFDFSMFWQGVGKWNQGSPVFPPGGDWWNNPFEHFIGNTWTPENTGALHPLLVTDGMAGWNYQWSDAPFRWENNKYFRLKNLQVGYTLPDQILSTVGISKFRVYFSGNDLFEVTNVQGDFDPENFERVETPFSRSYSLGIDITF